LNAEGEQAWIIGDIQPQGDGEEQVQFSGKHQL
jgi:phosphoribosylformylglycinamidine cyclo-ligase